MLRHILGMPCGSSMLSLRLSCIVNSPVHLQSVMLTACMCGINSLEFVSRTVSKQRRHISNSKYCIRVHSLSLCTLSRGILLHPAQVVWVELDANKLLSPPRDGEKKEECSSSSDISLRSAPMLRQTSLEAVSKVLYSANYALNGALPLSTYYIVSVHHLPIFSL